MHHITLALLFAAQFTFAQKLRFDNYSLNDGLSQSTLVSMVQDRQGFIWIGTEDGLNRFDGYSFRIYKKDPKDTLHSIGGNFVWDLYEATDGKIWIAHEGGFSCFDPLKDSFQAFRIGDGSTTVRSIYPKDTTGLWLGTNGQGLFYFDIASRKLTSFINGSKDILKYNNILDLGGYHNGDLMIGTRGGGLFLFNTDKKFYRPALQDPADSLLLYTNDIWKIVHHKDQYWLGTLKGLVKLDEALTLQNHYPLTRGEQAMQRISTFLFDQDETVWVACYGGGLVHFDPATAEYKFYTHSPIDPASLANNLVFSLLMDRSENLWVGTWVAGISKLRKGHNNFRNYSNYDIGTPSNFITSVITLPCGDQQNLLLGAYGGGIQIASLDKQAEALQFSKYTDIPETTIKAVDAINCFYKGKDHLWVGSDVGGIVGIPVTDIGCVKKTTEVIRYEANGDHSLNHNTVKSIVEDNEGNLWAGTLGGGLNKIAAGKKPGEPASVIHYTYDENNPASLSHNRVNRVFKDRLNNIWVATSNGLNLFRENGFQHFLKGKIITMMEHSQGDLFIGTEDGLFRSRKQEGEFSFTVVEPLSGQLINAAEEDAQGKIWAATNKGLFWYDLANNTAMQFRSSDGLQGDEYNFNASAGSGNGLLAFGGVNGLTIFNPATIILNTTPPPVTITSLKIANKEIAVSGAGEKGLLQQSINYSRELTLPYHQNYLTFSFSALDFTNPSKNMYAHTLEGLDDNWIYSTASDRSVTYTNLDPGTYVLRVRASNNDGTWNEEGSVITIVINPPWWKTRWAYVLYTLIIIAILWLARRNIIQRERLKNQLQLESVEVKKLKELDDFKSKFFANISHEFRTPLSLILGPTEKLLTEGKGKNRNELTTIQNNSRSLLNLVNQMLDLSRIEAGSLRLQVRKADLTNYLRVFAEAFQSLATQKDIGFTVDLPAERINGYCDLSFLEKIINNLLSNAIKYTSAGGTITFLAEEKQEQLTLTVSDTGMGIAPDQLGKIFDRFYRVHDNTSVQGTGLGLALTKELVKIHKGDIRVSSVVQAGSSFTVTLPVGKDAYAPADISHEETEILPEVISSNVIAPEEKIPTPANGSKPVVLIVEDNNELRDFIGSALADHYRILEASDGESGLKLATDEIPDIIVSDWMMPKMDGLVLCRHIKTTETTDHIPIILLTAKAGSESRIEGLVNGADDYLTKPFDLRELKTRVANLIEQRKKLRMKFAQNKHSLYKPIKAESADEKFLKKLQEIVEQHMGNSKFGVEEMAREVGMSRVQLYRKLTALANQTAVEFLRNYRLERAADLLKQGAGNVSEIAFRVGFDNPSYFTKTFREHFGRLPSEVGKS